MRVSTAPSHATAKDRPESIARSIVQFGVLTGRFGIFVRATNPRMNTKHFISILIGHTFDPVNHANHLGLPVTSSERGRFKL